MTELTIEELTAFRRRKMSCSVSLATLGMDANNAKLSQRTNLQRLLAINIFYSGSTLDRSISEKIQRSAGDRSEPGYKCCNGKSKLLRWRRLQAEETQGAKASQFTRMVTGMINYSDPYLMSARPQRREMDHLLKMYRDGEKIAMLTCYESSFAALMDRCGVDILFVGDSLGNVCQGQASTLPVTMEHMAYHTRCVSRGVSSAFLIVDMPYGTYATPRAAIRHASMLMQAGAQMVKLEGGAWLQGIVSSLVHSGIPVCAHVGLTPQYVHSLGGYKVQGKTAEASKSIKDDALALQDAGAKMLVIEAVPKQVGKEITDALSIPTIGIGAGPHCSGQVLVMHDMLGVSAGKAARFVKNFMEGQSSVEAAMRSYVADVKSNTFPAAEHCY